MAAPILQDTLGIRYLYNTSLQGIFHTIYRLLQILWDNLYTYLTLLDPHTFYLHILYRMCRYDLYFGYTLLYYIFYILNYMCAITYL